jgi:glycosyltransferase involved in cell wall biosynthesis
MDVLIIYQLCSFGGVERAILNRARAFRKSPQNVNLSVGYLHDYGALLSFQEYIHIHELDDFVSAFLITDDTLLDLNKFDFVLIIDTPQIFERTLHANNVFVECHTPYIENRQYLKELPPNIRGILVPSKSFRILVAGEFPGLPPIFVLPNSVSEEFFDTQSSRGSEYFSKRPITYLARIEDNKNFREAACIYEMLADIEEVMFIVIGSGADDESLIHSLERKGLIEKTLLRDRIGFDQAASLVNLVKRQRGVFVSPSKGESFGLSAAEFISGGVPVLLSDIPAHKELVEDDDRFLYHLGNIASTRTKIINLLKDWGNMSKQSLKYAQKFRDDVFLKAWQEFTTSQKPEIDDRISTSG